MQPEISSCGLGLWILETDRGTKRTYAKNEKAARTKAESKGLVVNEVRAGKVSDLPENMR